MWSDLRYAVRVLVRRPMFTLVAVLTVALGVGANTAVFSVADSVLFRPLTFPGADRLFVLRIADVRTRQTYWFLPASAIDAARASGSFDVVTGAEPRDTRVYVRREDGLAAVILTPVAPDFLDVLGVRPLLGRTFAMSDTGTRAVLLSYRSWVRDYGADPSVVGRTVPGLARTMDVSNLPDGGFRIIGVLPPRLRAPLLAAPDGLVLMEAPRAGAVTSRFTPLVRLKAGVTRAAAEAQLSGVRGEELVPGQTALRLVPVREEMAGRQDPVFWLLIAAATIVLVVACVNLANLIVARGSARTRELAIRAALGGSRARLARLLLVEALCVAALGTAAGVLLGFGGFLVLSAQLPPLLAQIADPAFDARALGFAVLTACATAAAFTVLPVLRLSRADARDGLRASRLHAAAPRRGRGVLVAVEVATCLGLLVGAALVGRTLITLLSEDLGFEPHRVAITFDLPTLVLTRHDGFLPADKTARLAFYRERLNEIRALPGVRAAGATGAAPFSGNAPDSPLTEDRVDRGGGVYAASSGYFSAIGMPLLAGRDFTDQESFTGAQVGVLNDTAARRMCGGPASCLGTVVRPPSQPARTVIGVVGDARRSVRRAPIPAMYVPFETAHFVLASLVVDADDTAESRAALKRALSIFPDARVQVRSLDDARLLELSPFRFNAIVIGAFAVLTLVLAVVGVYGVMSAVVGERTREYGIRLAMGATRERVNRHVLAQAARPIGAGAVGGLLLALWGARYVSSLLYGVQPIDLRSFAAAAAVVLASALAAAFVPAHRAGRVDPIVALRAE
jgi:predicted permease